jgi:SAM-dependent methyltransferase
MEQSQIPKEHDPVRWWSEHYDGVATQIVEFLVGDGFELRGKSLADVGSGDGIIDLGLVHRARPAKLVGYDVRVTDVDALRRSAEAAGVEAPFPGPDELAFVESEADHLPALDATFDLVFSWSVFEHVSQPVVMLREVSRVLKPDGLFFLQIWPLFNSRHGGHAWMAIDEPFAHLTNSPFTLRDQLRGRQGTDPTRTADDEFESLNRLTLDQLQRALLLAHMRISKLELISEVVHIPPDLAHHNVADLAVSGVKLLAAPF